MLKTYWFATSFPPQSRRLDEPDRNRPTMQAYWARRSLSLRKPVPIVPPQQESAIDRGQASLCQALRDTFGFVPVWGMVFMERSGRVDIGKAARTHLGLITHHRTIGLHFVGGDFLKTTRKQNKEHEFLQESIGSAARGTTIQRCGAKTYA